MSSNNGKQGERLFKQMMETSGYTVVDVSGDSAYWDKDIDFIITSPTSGLTKTFEVKWDSRIGTTGNLYLELTNIHSKQWNGEGWWPHCQADFLVYGDAQNNIFHIAPLEKLRERVEQLPLRRAQCGYDSIGQLINIKDIQDIIITVKG